MGTCFTIISAIENMMAVSGETSSQVRVFVENNDWGITGVDGKCEVSTFDLDSPTMDNIKKTSIITADINDHIVVTTRDIYND